MSQESTTPPEGPTPSSVTRGDRNVLLAIIWFIGALVRLFPLMQFPEATGRPFGMGGLYLLFAQEILRHGFALPTRIPYYTAQGLPYAYPPLAFYLEALALRLFPVSPFILTNVLPALFSILTIGAFFLLAREFFPQERKALLATAIYTLLPAAFLEHLPGEGLVESLGTAMFIGGILWFLRLNRRPRWPESVLLGVLVGLNLLASPGGAYGLAVSMALLWLLHAGGRRAPLWRFLIAGGIGLALSAPYWLTVTLRHTPAIFARTFFQQHTHLGVWLLAKAGFLVEQRLPLSPWGILALIGLAASLAHKRLALPLWCLAIYLIPREFAYLVAVPLALLAAHGLHDVVLPGAAGSIKDDQAEPTKGRSIAAGLILFALFTWGLIRAFAWAAALPSEKDLVTTDELAMMDWIRGQTSAEATFIVIGDEVEWFPVLTERTTLNVIWGSEWSEDATVFELDGDLSACRLPRCYLETASEYDLLPEYLYISRTKDHQCLIEAAAQSEELELVWENEGAALFRVRW